MRCNQFCRSKKAPEHKTATASNQRELPPAAIGTAPLAPHSALSQQLDHQAPPHSNTTPQLQAKISAATMGRSQRQPPAPLSVVVPKPLQSDLKPGSGRHPHPPSSANTKLKHKCPFDGCPWRFATPYKLRRHIKSHTKETPFRCKECGRGFSVRYNLLMHIQTIHSQPQRYKCPIRGCKDAFHTQPRLNGHLRKVHKKEWKTLQTNGSETSKSCNSRASSTSSLDSTESKTPTSQTTKFECPICKKECLSQSKLTIHMRSHTGEKPFKCSTQGCDKAFAIRERLTRHQETHKNMKQFRCPHKNCNRVFLRQSHLKNHLKIHTQDHQFVCPVLDCSQKFSSETAYNEHLNTHINYGHRCPYPGCDLSFPTPMRLGLHCRAVHSNSPATLNSGAQQSCLPNSVSSPHLGHPPRLQDTLPPTSASCQDPAAILNFVNEEIIKDVDLPGLAVEDIEAVLSENTDWSGEQIEQFLRSAVDLSEIEAKLFSATGYESDSGYSTYDVSPITSNAPMPLNCVQPGSLQNRSLSPALTPVNPTPFFHCNLSPTNPSFPPPPPHMIHPALPDPVTSPIGEVSFFSASQHFGGFGPSQDVSATYLPNQASSMFAPPPPPHPPVPYSSQPQEYCSPAVSSVGPYYPENLSTGSSIDGFSSQFTDLLASEATLADNIKPADLRSGNTNPLSCRMTGDGLISYGSFTSDEKPASLVGEDCLPESRSLSDLEIKNKSVCPKAPVAPKPVVKPEDNMQARCSLSSSDPAEAIVSDESPCSESTSGDSTDESADITTTIKMETSSAPCTNQLSPNLLANLQNLPNIPGINTQLLQSLCSQMPALSKLLASSSNPAIFLVAISTALSTLTKPFLNNGVNVNVSGLPGITSELSKLPPTDIAQLQSQIARLGADQIEKLISLKTESAPYLCTATTPRPCTQATGVPLQGQKPAGGTVFARILPTQCPPISSTPLPTSSGALTTVTNSAGQQVGANLKDAAQHGCFVNGTGSVSMKLLPKNQRARLHKTGSPVAMKPSHKKTKQSQWPRSMNKANLMAFREHILNKLKRQEEANDSCSEGQNGCPLTASTTAIRSAAAVKLESPSPSSEYKVEVMYERNHSMEGRCHSEPADLLNSMSTSPTSLRLGHSASASDISTVQGKSLQLSDLLFQDDIFSDFQFNPDTLLSSSALSMEVGVLDMFERIEDGEGLNCGGSHHGPDLSAVSEEIAQLLGDDDSSNEAPTPCEQKSMEIDCIREFLSDTQDGHRHVLSPNQIRMHADLQRSCGETSTGRNHYSSGQQYLSPTLSENDRIAIETSEALRQCVPTPTYTFPELNSIHGSWDNLTINGEAALKFQCFDSILQTQHDPLLAGSTCTVSEAFDI